MAAPITIQQLSLPTLSDPDNVAEVFCNDVLVQVRAGGVQVTFNSIQASEVDAFGIATDRRVVRSRVGMPVHVAIAMVTVFQQLNSAIQMEAALAPMNGEKTN